MLNFYGSLKLLGACEDAGICKLNADARTLARKLMNDLGVQEILIDLLAEKGVTFTAPYEIELN